MASPLYLRKVRHRRILVALVLFPCICFFVALRLPDWIGGAFRSGPVVSTDTLSPRARALAERAFADLDASKLFDYHTHVLGVGAGGTGNFVNPRMVSFRHPMARLRFSIYRSAAGIEDLRTGDQEYARRLIALAGEPGTRGRFLILAFDQHYKKDGTPDPEHTEFHVPNDYVWGLARDNPAFVPGVSIHPYRRDALEQLETWAARGVRYVKWLPNAMGMDPADPAIIPYYKKMKKLGMVLLSHAGEEKAVEGEQFQDLGNPLRFRLPLDLGLRVVMAHCASLGDNEDLDHPGRRVPSFDLFLRLMGEKKYEGLLFGEISAMTQINRAGHPLATMLRRSDLHGRLVNGSDYPLPGVNFLIGTRSLARAGFISDEERSALNEIYEINPLLFDFVLKRTLHAPGEPGARFAPGVFLAHPVLSSPGPKVGAVPWTGAVRVHEK